MLNHVNPQQMACEYVNGCRSGEQESKESAEKEGAAPEPEVPLRFTNNSIGECRRNHGSDRVFSPYILDDDTPTSEVQDFGNKTSKQQIRWDRPPVCINPDVHCCTPLYQ